MNAFPAGAGPPELDWERWATILQQYAGATGLVVSVYDRQLQRRIGPLHSSRLARAFATTRLWSQDGPGSALEKKLAALCMQNDTVESQTYCTELHLRALPITLFGQVSAAIVYGWVYCGFPTALANEQVAHDLGVSAPKLWREVRLEAPISPSRLTSFCELLETLVASNIHQTEAIEDLQALARMREVFLARVSHELRTPLSALSYRLQALLLGPLDDPVKIRTMLENMQGSIREEGQLIEDLIDAARTRTGKLSVSTVATRLVPILEAAVAAIQPQAESKQVRLHLQGVDAAHGAPLAADEQRLQQVFWNLLSNAVKFTPASGTVMIELSVREETYAVSVTDTGVGIEEKLLPRLFETFVKQEKNNEKGLGLGLSIARHIVDLHGGSLQVFSAGRGKGATFTVVLPRDGNATCP